MRGEWILSTTGTIARNMSSHRNAARSALTDLLADNRFVTGESDLSIHLEKVLPAPPVRVFAACVEPEKLAEWWGPAGFTTPSLELDVRSGGRYRITMQPPHGDAFHLRGEFREVDPPRRLVYTFVWEEPDPDDQETVVTLSFLGGEATKLVVDQGPFATEARRALHEAGWTESLERLEESVGGDRHYR
jgi:uncharacterized protein YndB with AHSA1/START domain